MTAPRPDTLPAPPPESGLTLEDVIRARLTWRATASPAWRTLLDAQPADDRA